MAVISMKQLLEAGVHFGHQTRRWNPKMARYIFTERNGIYIIDLQKTVRKVDEAYNFLRSVAQEGKSVLFIGTKVYFAHPYSSWERPQNERHNGILLQYIPKGTDIDGYSDEDILNIADEINSRPRRVLDYQTPAELFKESLIK